jgi:hypothetical protein
VEANDREMVAVVDGVSLVDGETIPTVYRNAFGISLLALTKFEKGIRDSLFVYIHTFAVFTFQFTNKDSSAIN